MRLNRQAVWSALALLLTLSGAGLTSVQAHGGHSEAIKLRLAATSLQLDTHLSAKALLAFDKNQDGRLSHAEFLQQFTAIKDWVDQRIRLSGAQQQLLVPSFFDLPVSDGDLDAGQGEVRHVHVIRHYTVAASGPLKLQLNLPSDTSKALIFVHGDSVYNQLVGPGETGLVLR